MRARSIAVLTVTLIGTATLIPAAAYATGTTLYVYGESSSCSDSGTGTEAIPYCTIQAADDAAQPGDTVHIGPGDYAPVTITNSGTAAAPITFVGTSDPTGSSIYSNEWNGSGIFAGASDAAALSFSGAGYIDVDNLEIYGGTDESVQIDNSSNIVISHDDFDGLTVGEEGGQETVAYVHVTGGSSDVAVEKSVYGYNPGPDGTTSSYAPAGILVDGGSTGTIVSTNLLGFATPVAVAVNGATDTAVTSNTIDVKCTSGVTVANSSAGTTVENNIGEEQEPGHCPPPVNTYGISVDSSSAASTTVDYNDVDMPSETANYSWGGTALDTAAALYSATGQGKHDLNVLSSVANSTLNPLLINSANSGAPGELPTDIDDNFRAIDPLVPQTGVGPYHYYDRGAFQLQDPMTFTSDTVTPDPENFAIGEPVKFSAAATDTWSSKFDYTYDFGDGTSATGASATHVYTVPAAKVAVQIWASPVGGTDDKALLGSFDASVSTTIPVASQFLSVSPENGLTMKASTDAAVWPIALASTSFDFGDGSSAVAGVSGSASHTYAKPGTYTVTETVTDADGNTGTSTQTVTTAGSDYTAYGPVRLLDTRSGLGEAKAAPVAAGGVLDLQIAHNRTIPLDVTAVALNLTVTNTKGSGYITAYPSGQTMPDSSDVNYTAGQTTSNSVIVPVNDTGDISLYNGGADAKTTDLIADVTGYFTQTATSGYTPLSPGRILDTRNGTGAPKAQLDAGDTTVLTVAGADSGSLPATGITAVALNLTVTNTSGSGFLTAFPDGEAVPTASNINYAPGSTGAASVIVPVGKDGKVDIYNGGGSAGKVDVIGDVVGYFSGTGVNAYVPVTPDRILDTRTTSGPVAGGHGLTIDPAGLDQSLAGSDPAAYVVNTTVTGTGAAGWLAVTPPVSGAPTTSTINWTGANQTVPNLALAVPGANGDLEFYNGGAGARPVQVIVDLFGYFSAS